ncbi:MAG: RHS repeat-associated core domain-containing protein, partial [Candidatus Angelobacter sp.]
MTHDASVAYGYDGGGRLYTVTNTAEYTYFGGLRIKKVVGSTTTVTIYSGANPIAEYVNGALSKEYIYSGSALLATIAGGVVTYHNPDHLSDRAEKNASAATVRTYGHFPFGETWYETGTADKWKFTSYGRDTGESDLDYATFRYYGSTLGRFSSPDLLGGSLGNPESLNRYGYVLSDPVNTVDTFVLAPQRINCNVDMFGHCIVVNEQGGATSCNAGGAAIPCDMLPGLLSSGGATICPGGDCSLIRTGPNGQWQIFVSWPGAS